MWITRRIKTIMLGIPCAPCGKKMLWEDRLILTFTNPEEDSVILAHKHRRKAYFKAIGLTVGGGDPSLW
jgi:hypothetical protein